MCSFGGKILPRPHDNRLCYVGGDSSTPFSEFLTKLSKLSGKGIDNLNVKYQLPNEDLDALISVSTDEDLENMMDEYDRLARLRVFLFAKDDDDDSRPSSISSLMDGMCMANREHWFLDALNNGANSYGLQHGRSVASSVVSEVPDYLLVPENSDEVQVRDPKLRTRQLLHEDVSVSDTSSPAAALESFAEQPVAQPIAYSGSPMLHYISESHYSAPPNPIQQIPIPIYYDPGPVQSVNPPFQPVQIEAQYVQQYPVPAGQMPMGYPQLVPGVGQVYRPVTYVDPYDPALRVAPDSVNQPVYYGYRNSGPVLVHPGMVSQGGGELASIWRQVGFLNQDNKNIGYNL
ncbi:hypothetical protein V6N13_120034 [Hibiscus sabdariffa]|uniref:PB1 domain-containing protein n=2 Tax=Hibiscus sabdariffa TaxID=183260 RepID=A0ABR2A5D7_9ROSI